jgi:hypothetical protein
MQGCDYMTTSVIVVVVEIVLLTLRFLGTCNINEDHDRCSKRFVMVRSD